MMLLPTVKVPVGFDYQWVTLAVAGDEKIGDFQRMREGGWRPVPFERHPEVEERFRQLVINGPNEGEQRIVAGGLILVERPKILTTQSRAIEKRAADAPIEALREANISPHLIPRPSTNAFHWWPRLKFQLRRPAVWAIGAIWRWWRK